MERVRKPRMAKRKKITALHLNILRGQCCLFSNIFEEIPFPQIC